MTHNDKDACAWCGCSLRGLTPYSETFAEGYITKEGEQHFCGIQCREDFR